MNKILVLSHYEKGGGNPLDSLWFSAPKLKEKGLELHFYWTKEYDKSRQAIQQFDVVLFDGLGSLQAFEGPNLVKAAIEGGKKIAIYWHETDWYFNVWPANRTSVSYFPLPRFFKYRRRLLPVQKLLQNDAIHHFHVCNYGKRMMVNRFGYPEDNIFVLPNITWEVPIEECRLVRKPIPKRVVGCGKTVPRKRPDLFIEVAEKVIAKDPEASFVYLGNFDQSPWDEASIKQRVLEKGLDDKLKFIGFQKHPHQHMAQGEVLLHTSEDDPSPKVIMEGLGLGLYPTAFAVNGIPEIIKDYGKAVPFEDTDALAAAVLTGFDHQSEKEVNSRQIYYNQNYSTSAFASRFIEAFAWWNESLGK